jgi:hypothetical protein
VPSNLIHKKTLAHLSQRCMKILYSNKIAVVSRVDPAEERYEIFPRILAL